MSFDWTKVEGYNEEMTPEEKIALLESYEPEETPKEKEPEQKPSAGYVSKKRFDEVASELAKTKKELKSRLSTDEQAEMERQTRVNEMETELEELRHDKKVSTYKASYLAQGYDEKLADEAANAMADGDSDKLFTAMKRFNDAQEKALKAKLMQETPRPPASDTKEEKPEDKMVAAMRKAMGLPPTK